MDNQLARQLGSLARLDRANIPSPRPCKICERPSTFFDAGDFWKKGASFPFGVSGITILYYRCNTCGFMFTSLCDDWTAADFSQHIYNDQYILLDPEYAAIRPRRAADSMMQFLRGFEDARILDYGSGTGLFARHMREGGFEQTVSYDPFSQPERPTGRFDIITCFEVIEHSPTPLATIQDLASFLQADGCVLFGESLQPPDITSIRSDWWYCMPRNGHISFYTDMALAIAAGRAGLRFHRGSGLHAFSSLEGDRFSRLGRRISPPLVAITLNAPQDAKPASWHGIERFSGAPTRWTASRDLSWRVAVPSRGEALAKIRIPFVQEIRPGFGAESVILVGGTEVATQVADRVIAAEVAINASASIDITLRTPEPIAPSQIRNTSDNRRLGLAIYC